ncbi:hypothetical protein [Mesorhizobium marinum]
MTRYLVLAVGLIVADVAHADEVVRSEDGREILLRSDGTYEVLIQNDARPSVSYRQMSIVDLKLDIDGLEGQLVEVSGKLSSFGGLVMIGDPSSNFDATPIAAEAEKLSRDERRYIIEKCNLGCRVTIRAEVVTVMFQPGLELHQLIR